MHCLHKNIVHFVWTVAALHFLLRQLSFHSDNNKKREEEATKKCTTRTSCDSPTPEICNQQQQFCIYFYAVLIATNLLPSQNCRDSASPIALAGRIQSTHTICSLRGNKFEAIRSGLKWWFLHGWPASTVGACVMGCIVQPCISYSWTRRCYPSRCAHNVPRPAHICVLLFRGMFAIKFQHAFPNAIDLHCPSLGIGATYECYLACICVRVLPLFRRNRRWADKTRNSHIYYSFHTQAFNNNNNDCHKPETVRILNACQRRYEKNWMELNLVTKRMKFHNHLSCCAGAWAAIRTIFHIKFEILKLYCSILILNMVVWLRYASEPIVSVLHISLAIRVRMILGANGGVCCCCCCRRHHKMVASRSRFAIASPLRDYPILIQLVFI